MPSYFHWSPLLLGTGSVIQPGAWGRNLNIYATGKSNAWMLAREMAFEAVRALQFPDLPSRLSAAFTFETVEDANRCQGEFAAASTLYEVELVSADSPSHRAGFNLIGFPKEGEPFLPVVTRLAERYWRGEAIEIPEVLTLSPLRVVSIVQSPPRAYQP